MSYVVLPLNRTAGSRQLEMPLFGQGVPVEVHILGAHQCESTTTKCFSLLIDGVLAIDAGSLTSSLSFADQEKIRAILLTHYHYDHIKDIPTLGLNTLRSGKTNVYSTEVVRKAVFDHILNGEIWPDLTTLPSQHSPSMTFHTMEPGRVVEVEGYEVLPIQVQHSVPSIGYQVSHAGKKVFYTGDTGGNLDPVWSQIAPDLLITEVTFSDQLVDLAHQAQHLTPSLLRKELESFRRTKGYLPKIVVVHINPAFQDDIALQLSAVARELGAEITLSFEGLRIGLA